MTEYINIYFKKKKRKKTEMTGPLRAFLDLP